MKNTNREIEARAAKAAKGEGYSWNKTPIGETATAQATDPMRGAGCRIGDGWWEHGEPPFLRQQGDRLARSIGRSSGAPRSYGRDHEDPRSESEKYNDTTGAADAAEKWREYLGEPDEDANGWLANLATKLDMNTEAHEPWFAVLRAYVGNLPVGTKCRELDEKLLQKCLEILCD